MSDTFDHACDAMDRALNGEGDFRYGKEEVIFYPNLTLHDVTVVANTEKAVLLRREDMKETWVPYSQIRTSGYLGVGDKLNVEVTGWIIRKLIWRGATQPQRSE